MAFDFDGSVAINDTDIPGLLVVRLSVHGDRRGWFKENWQREKMVNLGLPDFLPVQNNISFNADIGTTRGMHAEPWDKYVSVASGEVFGAWVDLREGASFGRKFTIKITPDIAVFVPAGVANGFQALTSDVAYSYLVNAHWSPEARSSYRFLNLADTTVNIPWPLPRESWVLSEADRTHPFLCEVQPFARKAILVIGKSGQLSNSLKELSHEVDLNFVGRPEVDMSQLGWAQELQIADYAAVINAAAYTAVDAAETEEGAVATWRINATAVQELASECAKARVPLVHISSDYTYSATSTEWLDESTPLGPLGVYGSAKAAADLCVGMIPAHYIVRTSWLVGAGKNFVRTMATLAKRNIEVRVVNDQIGRLTFTDDLAAFVLHLLRSHAPYGTYNFTNEGEPQSWFDIAQAVYRQITGSTELVVGVSTEVYSEGKELARRPSNSRLSTKLAAETGFIARTQLDALMDYLGELD